MAISPWKDVSPQNTASPLPKPNDVKQTPINLTPGSWPSEFSSIPATAEINIVKQAKKSGIYCDKNVYTRADTHAGAEAASRTADDGIVVPFKMSWLALILIVKKKSTTKPTTPKAKSVRVTVGLVVSRPPFMFFVLSEELEKRLTSNE